MVFLCDFCCDSKCFGKKLEVVRWFMIVFVVWISPSVFLQSVVLCYAEKKNRKQLGFCFLIVFLCLFDGFFFWEKFEKRSKVLCAFQVHAMFDLNHFHSPCRPQIHGFLFPDDSWCGTTSHTPRSVHTASVFFLERSTTKMVDFPAPFAFFSWGSTKTRWWFQIFCIFTPTRGNDPIWRAFFQMGWHHQLENTGINSHIFFLPKTSET